MKRRNENDLNLDLPSLATISFGLSSFALCHVAVFESTWWLFIFVLFIILDLSKLHTISFKTHDYENNFALRGDWRDDRQAVINGHESYDNTLIMKSI